MIKKILEGKSVREVVLTEEFTPAMGDVVGGMIEYFDDDTTGVTADTELVDTTKPADVDTLKGTYTEPGYNENVLKIVVPKSVLDSAYQKLITEYHNYAQIGKPTEKDFAENWKMLSDWYDVIFGEEVDTYGNPEITNADISLSGEGDLVIEVEYVTDYEEYDDSDDKYDAMRDRE